ncbi:MAG: hypothetical protein RL491_1271, partial [Bacteroidota bacterium]
IGTEQTEYLALHHLEADAIYSPQRAVLFYQILNGDDWVHEAKVENVGNWSLAISHWSLVIGN